MLQRTLTKTIKEISKTFPALLVTGARQVGKTTLINKIKENSNYKTIYLNCDESDVRQTLTNKTSTELKNFIGDNKLIIIDETQRVQNIGLSLKLLADNFKDIQIIAT